MCERNRETESKSQEEGERATGRERQSETDTQGERLGGEERGRMEKETGRVRVPNV